MDNKFFIAELKTEIARELLRHDHCKPEKLALKNEREIWSRGFHEGLIWVDSLVARMIRAKEEGK